MRRARADRVGRQGGARDPPASDRRDLTAPSYGGELLLPRRLAAFHAAHPGVQLEVVIRNTREVENAVVDGDAHLGLVEGPTQNRALLRQQVDTDRPLLVVAAKYPPLPRTPSGQLDLRAIPWVVREEGSGTRHVLEELAAGEGLTLRDLSIFLVLPGNEAIREAVEAGRRNDHSEHVVRPRRDRLPVRIRLICRSATVVLQHRERQLSVAQQALVKHLATTDRTAGGKVLTSLAAIAERFGHAQERLVERARTSGKSRNLPACGACTSSIHRALFADQLAGALTMHFDRGRKERRPAQPAAQESNRRSRIGARSLACIARIAAAAGSLSMMS
jgi:DNA-binding transcriptional LysR family regulator